MLPAGPSRLPPLMAGGANHPRGPPPPMAGGAGFRAVRFAGRHRPLPPGPKTVRTNWKQRMTKAQ
eukprot:10047018-Alexandrium_andersonii.AAC.1